VNDSAEEGTEEPEAKGEIQAKTETKKPPRPQRVWRKLEYTSTTKKNYIYSKKELGQTGGGRQMTTREDRSCVKKSMWDTAHKQERGTFRVQAGNERGEVNNLRVSKLDT